MKKLFTLTLFSFLITSLYSQEDKTGHTIITDRPDLTESPNAVPAKSVQTETGFVFSKMPTSDNAKIFDISYLGTLIRIGAIKRFEIRIGIGMDHQLTVNGTTEKEFGVTPIDIGFKTQINEGSGWLPTVGIIGNLTFPVGPFRADHIAPQVILLASHAPHDKVSFSYNAGLFWTGDDPYANFLYSYSVGISPAEKFGLFVEVYGNKTFKKKKSSNHGFDGGFTYLLRPNLQFDASAGTRIHGDMADWFTSLGFSFLLGRYE